MVCSALTTSGHISLMGVSHWPTFWVLFATFLLVPSGGDFFLKEDIKVQPGKVAAKGFFFFMAVMAVQDSSKFWAL